MSEGNVRKSIGAALVADDQGVTRFGLVQYLRDELGVRESYEATRFTDALEIMKNQKVDLAIFDLRIPGMKSTRDLAQVRERWPDVKVVVFSGSQQRTDILGRGRNGLRPNQDGEQQTAEY